MYAKPISGVYSITHLPSGRRYIGSSVVVQRRKNGHYYLLRAGRHHAKFLQALWNKHGEAEFEFAVVERCLPDQCIEREQHWIDALQPVLNGCSTAKAPALDVNVRDRIKQGMADIGRRFNVAGEMLRVSDIRVKYGVWHTVFYQRLKRGWDVQRAATTPPNKNRTKTGARTHLYRGELYTLAELVPFARCSKTALFRRIASGMSVEEAVEMSPEQAEKRRVARSVAARKANNE